MNDEMKITAMGAYLYGVLYLIGVFVAGIAYGNPYAVCLANAAAAASYITQMAIAIKPTQAWPLYGSAILLSAAAGFSLAF